MDITPLATGPERVTPDVHGRKVQLATSLLISAVTLLLCLGSVELAGFIGSHLVDALATQGHQVQVFDNLESQVHGGLRGEAASLIMMPSVVV